MLIDQWVGKRLSVTRSGPKRRFVGRSATYVNTVTNESSGTVQGAILTELLPMGVEFVGIQLVGLDSVNDGQEFVELLDVNYALGPDEDGAIIRDYKVTGFPTTWFIDENHQVSRKWTGILTEDKLEELIEELLN